MSDSPNRRRVRFIYSFVMLYAGIFAAVLNARSLVREVMPSFDFHAGEDITEFLNFVHKHGRLATELVFGMDITAHITARTSISMN